MKNKNILIIAYKFPPMGGIGTRRWAKFAKYLAKDGYKVHVLTINYKKIDKVNWLKDIENNKNIIIHRIKAVYPLWLLNVSNNKYIAFIQKLLNFILKKTIFYIDIAQYWYIYMIPEAKNIINKFNIKNVIVTNPPPSVSYNATYLKIDFPNINLIQDFRDSWNDDIDYNYPKTLKFFWQKEKSAYMEWFVINHSDYIINVSEDITNRTINKFKQYKNKFITIYNGFDRDDIKGIKLHMKTNDNKIKIIYAGGLGLGRIKAVELIMDVLLSLFEENLENLSKKLEINLYTSYNPLRLDKKYKKLIEKKIVNFYSLISSDEILKKINEHNYCLSINAPMYSYAFGTKIFDYMLLNKKIIHISNEGELSKILRKYKQYVTDYNVNNIEKILKQIISRNNDIYNDIDYQQFDLYNLVKKLEKLFI